jgi:hypothetical protein
MKGTVETFGQKQMESGVCPIQHINMKIEVELLIVLFL